MANFWLIADAHIDHRAIGMYRKGVVLPEDNNKLIFDFWKNHVTDRHKTLHRRDVVYCLGDMAFTPSANRLIQGMPGRKFLVRGNHDYVDSSDLLEVYEQIHGLLSKKSYWMSHAPVHPAELYQRKNIHGHVHEKSITTEDGKLDPRYLNVSVDALMSHFGKPMIDICDLRNYEQDLLDGKVKKMEHVSYTNPNKKSNGGA